MNPEQWSMIRSAYEAELPRIMEARARGGISRTDPYFIDWVPLFTPIEQNAWSDIRYYGVPLYPQFPVQKKFIDFADPYLKIGVELDGAAYHDKRTDTERDRQLWSAGWRIFRIKGMNSLASPEAAPPELGIEYYGSDDEYHQALISWGYRWSEGFFWALKKFYYDKNTDAQLKSVAEEILIRHTLVEFPLTESSHA